MYIRFKVANQVHLQSQNWTHKEVSHECFHIQTLQTKLFLQNDKYIMTVSFVS